LRREGRKEGKRPEKISHFLFGREDSKTYLCRPKSKIKDLSGINIREAQFFEIMK
jgi:hypothetical protein